MPLAHEKNTKQNNEGEIPSPSKTHPQQVEREKLRKKKTSGHDTPPPALFILSSLSTVNLLFLKKKKKKKTVNLLDSKIIEMKILNS